MEAAAINREVTIQWIRKFEILARELVANPPVGVKPEYLELERDSIKGMIADLYQQVVDYDKFWDSIIDEEAAQELN